MANPASITITPLAVNAGTNRPAVQTLDTDGTVPILAAAASPMDRLILELVNAQAVAVTVTIKGGQNPPSLGPRDLAIVMAATGGATATQIVGPFESGRFMKADGSVDIAVLAASGVPSVQVRGLSAA